MSEDSGSEVPCDIIGWIDSGYDDSDGVRVKFANLSQIVYKTNNDDREDALEQRDFSEFALLRNFSNEDVMTIWDIDCDKKIVVFRGTDIKNKTSNRLRDLGADAFIAAGINTSSPRFLEAEDILLGVFARYGKENVILAGHSLGGKIAYDLSRKYHVPAVVYNQGSSPIDTSKNRRSVHFNTNSDKFDPLSASSYYFDTQATIPVNVKTGNSSHTIDNFT